jgi:hypothetical protein
MALWRRFALLIATSSALLLAACGGGGGGGGGTAPPPGGGDSGFTLTVNISGNGSVASNPAGINCGTTCNAVFTANSSVTLTATPAQGQTFSGWGGACTGTASTCTVTMNEAKSVTATFTPAQGGSFALSVSVTGNGTVTSSPAGINCGTACNANFAASTSVTLTAAPAAGQSFSAWGGACSGSSPTCTVTMSQARSVTATFVPTQGTSFALSVSVTGSGTVTSSPAGINCGTSCNANFAANTSVTLTATPTAGQVFESWGGACTGNTATCILQMTQARSATATFAAAPPTTKNWQTAQLLESSNDFNVGSRFLTAIDQNGNALTVWEQSDGTPDGNTRKVFSRRYVAGQGWQAAVQVPNLATSSSVVALVDGYLLMDASGNATWIRSNAETRRYSPASGWSMTAFLPPNSTGWELPDARIDVNGNITLLVLRNDDVNVHTLASGATQWSAATNISQNTLNKRDAQIALSANGTAVAVWSEANPGDSNYSMMAARFVSGSWQPQVRIEEVLTNVNSDTTPRVGIDSAGNAITAWHQGNSIYYNTFNATTGAWGTATELDANQVSSTFTARIDVAMASNGRAVVGWNSGLFAFKAMEYSVANGAAAPVTVAPYSIDRTLRIDALGNAVVVYRSPNQWPNPTSASQNIYSRRLPVGGNWSAAELLESSDNDTLDVVFDMNASGQGVSVWSQNDAANTSARNSLWSNLLR